MRLYTLQKSNACFGKKDAHEGSVELSNTLICQLRAVCPPLFPAPRILEKLSALLSRWMSLPRKSGSPLLWIICGTSGISVTVRDSANDKSHRVHKGSSTSGLGETHQTRTNQNRAFSSEYAGVQVKVSVMRLAQIGSCPDGRRGVALELPQ